MNKIYTVWVNYGLEGWKPNDFETEAEAIEYVISGQACSEMRITNQLSITLQPLNQSPSIEEIDEIEKEMDNIDG